MDHRLMTARLHYHRHIPIIDRGFDRFEFNNDLGAILREAEQATCRQGAFDEE